MPCKVAISLRVVHAQGYHDPRDALSQDWFPFLASCDVLPVLIPNIGEDTAAYLGEMNVAGVLLTGGNNLCPESYCATDDTVGDTSGVRDKTESEMIRFANERNLPLIGVCRGMHMLNAYYGGTILPRLKEQIPNAVGHVACQHDVEIVAQKFSETFGVKTLQVNSYHDQGFTRQELAPALECIAVSAEDGVVEGLAHPDLPVVGIQWHPERPGSSEAFDRALVRRMFIERDFQA